MAAFLSGSEGQYKIFNYLTPDDVLEYEDFDSWRSAVGELTSGKIIVAWHHYTTPLKVGKLRNLLSKLHYS